MPQFHLVTAAAALAARKACLQVGGIEPAIKWPNDLLVGERKLAGILAESSGGAVVVGIGLNVHSCPPGSAALDEEAGRRVSRSELLVSWLRQLDSLIGRWREVSDLYRAACVTVGLVVRVERLDGPPLQGVALGIDDFGRLQVRGADGEGVVVAAGDVVHLRSGAPSGRPGTG